ncbi:YitT family protein [Noviherbaspirillum sp. UKPF54]|uniref:YitT family protein n=1 Tax=Noviherbaspirillum sp. UKPF54 TaxID=2601898 RepID=UPI001FED578F|nr:YitT family protein [Noviherbaspirillum sp. UKPF54]
MTSGTSDMNASTTADAVPQGAATPAALARHTLFEDAQALLSGTLLVSLGVAMLGKAHLITGGTVGLAFLLHYVTGISFGKLFFALNLPFYYLAVKKMGWKFTIKTFTAILLLSGMSEVLPAVFNMDTIHPAYAATMGGLLCGVGLLVLFRHKASLGGFNVMVLYLQERYGLRAGVVQLVLDGAIMLASLPMISPGAVAISLIGAAVLNMTLAVNHRPGRYMAI